MTIEQIETQAQAVSTARSRLTDVLAEMQAQRDKITKNYTDDLRVLVAEVQLEQDELIELIGLSPELFTKPKTRVLHSIKCGFRKPPSKVFFDDEEKVAGRIGKFLPDQKIALVKTKSKVDKKALQKLSKATLKKLGVSITDDTDDEVVCVPVADEFQKLIDSLLATADEPLE